MHIVLWRSASFPLFAQSVIYTKCLEGTTERSDSNRARSVRINEDGKMCLKGTTPKDWLFIHCHRRTAIHIL